VVTLRSGAPAVDLPQPPACKDAVGFAWFNPDVDNVTPCGSVAPLANPAQLGAPPEAMAPPAPARTTEWLPWGPDDQALRKEKAERQAEMRRAWDAQVAAKHPTREISVTLGSPLTPAAPGILCTPTPQCTDPPEDPRDAERRRRRQLQEAQRRMLDEQQAEKRAAEARREQSEAIESTRTPMPVIEPAPSIADVEPPKPPVNNVPAAAESVTVVASSTRPPAADAPARKDRPTVAPREDPKDPVRKAPMDKARAIDEDRRRRAEELRIRREAEEAQREARREALERKEAQRKGNKEGALRGPDERAGVPTGLRFGRAAGSGAAAVTLRGSATAPARPRLAPLPAPPRTRPVTAPLEAPQRSAMQEATRANEGVEEEGLLDSETTFVFADPFPTTTSFLCT